MSIINPVILRGVFAPAQAGFARRLVLREVAARRRPETIMLGIRKLLAASFLLAAGAAQAADDAVFVNAAAASDLQDGLSPKTAVRSIATGIQRAVGSGRSRVLVAAGSYGAFRMANGIEVAGGYTQDFGRMDVAPTEAVGAFMAELGQNAVVLADGITQATRLAGLTLRQSAASAAGRNTVGIVIRNGSSGLVVENVKIIGATAGAGLAGAAGSDASQLPAQAGAAGAAAVQLGFCNDSTRRAGGAGGQNNPIGPTAAGGAGGAGGTQSSRCGGVLPDLTPTSGVAGASTGSAQGGAGGSANSTAPAPKGADGDVLFSVDGAHGAHGNGLLVLVNGAPARTIGTAGALGQHGVGGAGGGGGIGALNGASNAGAGAGGGGGGAGGSRAPYGGQPGLAGGNSIGILVLDSNPVIRNCAIVRGHGGAGGGGGAGGRGQPGGTGGAGGAGLPGLTGTSTRGAGGAGGAGSRGGHSGPGAGGPGGHSIGILRHATSAPVIQSVAYSGGAGGNGGPAGEAHAGTGQAGLPGQVHGLLGF